MLKEKISAGGWQEWKWLNEGGACFDDVTLNLNLSPFKLLKNVCKLGRLPLKRNFALSSWEINNAWNLCLHEGENWKKICEY